MLRVLAFMEADRITGPAKNLLRFGVMARETHPELPTVELHVATYLRHVDDNLFLEEARSRDLGAHGIPESGRFSPQALGHIRALVDALQPDIIQTHNTKSHFLFRLTGCGKRIPWIAFNHGYTTEDLKMRLYNQLDRWSLRAPNQIVTMCQPFKDMLIQHGVDPRKIEIVPNAIEPAPQVEPGAIDAYRQRLGLRPEEAILIAIGRLSSEKGHAILLSALGRPELQRESWCLLVAGDGVEADALKQQAESLGIAGRIAWLGLLKNVQPLYALADVFVLPSLSEGSPNVLLEAMAAGNAIVTTRVGGVPEMVNSEQEALVIPPGQAEPMAVAILQLLQNRETANRLGVAAKLRTADFSPLAYRQRLSAIYDRLHSSKRDS